VRSLREVQRRSQKLCRGQTRPPEERGSRRRVGWSLGRDVRSPADYGVWGSVLSSSGGVRSEAPSANAFTAYSRPQNASRGKKMYFSPHGHPAKCLKWLNNTCCEASDQQSSSAVSTSEPTIIFVAVQS